MPTDRRVRLRGRQRGGTDVAVGTVGAGVGARAGVLKGGIGTASIRLEDIGVTVGAIVAVNSAGNVADPRTGLPWMAEYIAELGLSPAARGGDRGLRGTRRRTLTAEHHDRRRRHRRAAQPRRVPAGGRRRTGRTGAHDSARTHPTRRRLRVRASRRGPSRSSPRATHLRRCHRRPAGHGRRRRRGGLSRPGGDGRSPRPLTRWPEYRPTATCCPERSRTEREPDTCW